ncbi:hypothetical protein H4R26_001029 [Coemansia thaxteri]|uniref:Cation efflux protein transmembrane domain-containing protein n=1 Tax=Coemansia thaxteri TaxID=2663907 RepID=A0A9W8BMI3_9FUNG|nr:hypothetical protein H4R26_001029 [Coemansia thaxteri]KAJ2487107.1 hypothetical protein EV174_000718 [Coemansia sp. RSA 2320]
MTKTGKQPPKPGGGTAGKRAGSKKMRSSDKRGKQPQLSSVVVPPSPLPEMLPEPAADLRSASEPAAAGSALVRPLYKLGYGAIPYSSGCQPPEAFPSGCRRCQRIGSQVFDDGGQSPASVSSSITKSEALLVPQFVAAQVDDQSLRQIAQRSGPKVAAFYETQNELIADLLSVNQQHTDDTLEIQSQERRNKQRQVDLAVRVSVGVNVLVVLAQLYAAISSQSLALFATMSEAAMDLLSSIILLLASVAARRRDRFSLYPSGRFKLETIGVIVFAVLMGTFSVALLVESASALWRRESTPNLLSAYDAACVVAALAAKVVLYLYCYRLREYHTAHVLMTDHRNDVFVNAFGLGMAVVGKHAVAWMDPLGSLIIAVMILRSWVGEAWDQIKLIVGISADPRLIQVLTYTAITHDPRIEKVDRVVAYHSGAKLLVEVDIVMPPCTPLVMLHDVAESLQEKYERMPGVGRCHVHVDYEVTHRSEHHNAEA